MPQANPPLPYDSGVVRRERISLLDSPLLVLIIQMSLVWGFAALYLFVKDLRNFAQDYFLYLLLVSILGFVAHFIIVILPNLTNSTTEDYLILVILTLPYAWYYAVIVTSYRKVTWVFSIIVAFGLSAFTIALGRAIPGDVTAWHGTIQLYVEIAYFLTTVTIGIIFIVTKSSTVLQLIFSALSVIFFMFVLFIHSQLCLLRCGNMTRRYYVRKGYKSLKCTQLFVHTFIIFCYMLYILEYVKIKK